MSRSAARDENDAASKAIWLPCASKETAASFTELRERCLQGDSTAWRTLLERFAPLIYSVGRGCGLGAADCDDLLQSVALTLYTHLKEIREPDRLPGWLRQTTMRAALRIRKRLRRREQRETQVEYTDDLSPASPGSPETPGSAQQQAEDAGLLHEAIQQLNERCRGLLSALFLEPNEANYQEIADRLGIPVGSIGPTRQRCINQLRDVLKRVGFDHPGQNDK